MVRVMGTVKYVDSGKSKKAVINKPKNVDIPDALSQEFLDTLNNQFASFGADIKNMSEAITQIIDAVNRHERAIQFLLEKEAKRETSK